MLGEIEWRRRAARRAWAGFGTVLCGVGVAGLYGLGICALRCYLGDSLRTWTVNSFGERAIDAVQFAGILPFMAIILLSMYLADKSTNRCKSHCPSCNQDISTKVGLVLSTRCCPKCNERIVEGGRTHSLAAYERYRARRHSLETRQFLRYWFWIWPAASVIFTSWQLLDRSAWERHWHQLWLFPFLGASMAGWAWLRTGRRRYGLPFLASVALLGLAIALVWRSR